MTNANTMPNGQPGLIGGIISCVCAAFGFFVPVLGLLLAIIGLFVGMGAYKAGKRANYQPGLILGLIGAVISGVSLIIAALAVFALLGVVGGVGMLGAMR